MKMKLTLLIVMLCGGVMAQTSTVSYPISTEDIVNPERGFYSYSETLSSNPTPLNSQDLIDKRLNFYTSSGANYSVRSSLVFRYIVLDNFKNSAISSSFLNSLEQDFNTARVAGVKLIPRFAYTISVDNTNCSNTICPPYGDASKAIVLSHIAQLKPLLQAHGDVIACVQMGLVGIWGENYYTDYFGDASVQGYLSPTDWDNRSEVLDALLDAVPQNRMVQVRYPQIKQKYIYGNTASTDPAVSLPLTLGQAHDGSDIARLGFHNDCFLASNNDFGTYLNYDQNAAGSLLEQTQLRNYMAADADYTPVGGETCAENMETVGDDDCASTGGRADSDMDFFAYSYLNSAYNNPAVNNDWTGVCMDEIKNRLGYRLLISQAVYQNTVNPGEKFSVSIDIKNEGYAAMYNARLTELVLVNASTGQKYYGDLQADPRDWLSGSTNTVSYDFCTPTDMPAGQYQLYLNLADPQASIYDRPAYSIRLAHSTGWDASTGYNNLMHTLTVTANVSSTACVEELDLREVPIITNIHTTTFPDVKIFPNPVSGYFMITGSLLDYTVQIIDANGIVFQTLTGNSTIIINTATLPNGMYFVRVASNMNGTVHVEKIIKN